MGAVPYRRFRFPAAVGVLALTFGLAGCTAAPTARWGGPASAPGGDRPPLPSAPAAPSAADGTDVKACFDGECEIAVSDPVDIRLDPKFRIETLSITRIEPERVSFHGASAGGFVRATVGVGGTAILNGISVHVIGVHDGTAVLDFSPA